MLKAINTMANLIRPAADRRTTRHTRSPPSDDAQARHHQHHRHDDQPLSAALSHLPEAHDEHSPQQPWPAAAGARKRSIGEVDTPDTRLPSKVKQRRSHDDLSTWASDATKRAHASIDHVPSGASTPKPDDTPAMVDKKSLRSKDKNPVRGVSDLADIFDDYADIIAKWDDGEPTDRDDRESSASRLETDTPTGTGLTTADTSSLGSADDILVVDEPLTPAQLAELREAVRTKAAQARAERPPPNPNHAYTPRAPFDYTPYARALPTTADPLADSIYTKVHNRHEAGERKSRNRERDNLQYKMSKALPVLEELEGDDWHKVFVIDKATRDAWEPKRAFFIRELRTAIAKQDALRDIELRKRRREKEKRLREKETPSSDEDSDTDEPSRKRPPRKPRPPIHHPSPNTASPPHLRRPPRPHGFILDIPPEKPPSAFKSFYPRGQRPHFPSQTQTQTPLPPSSPSSSTPIRPTRPSTTSSRTTRSADAPPFGTALPAILSRVDDATLLTMMREDDVFAARGEPTEDVLLPDEKSFCCFALPVGFVTSEFLRENERKRRRRGRDRKVKG